ncbi:MAG: hypothetical protein ACSHYF_10300 [Verrucomicrobiaceae bacterium]
MNFKLQGQRVLHYSASALSVAAQRVPFVKHLAPLFSSPATLRLATPLTVSFAGIDTLTGQTTFVTPSVGYDNPAETTVGENFKWVFESGGNHTAASYSVTGLPPGSVAYTWGIKTFFGDPPREFLLPGGTLEGVITVPGSYQVTIVGYRFENLQGNKTPPYRLTINVAEPESPFQLWQELHWVGDDLADEAISGPNGDPDGDGIPNLLEFTLELNPKEKGVLPGTFEEDPEDPTMMAWEVPYIGTGNLVFQESDTGEADDWTDVPPTRVEVFPNWVIMRAPKSGGKKFFRMKATL